uniref:G protein-coupled receptor n=1 Tax=Haemonchus contortus TaxID=6289 RepID=A0A7I4YNQ1_HAECO
MSSVMFMKGGLRLPLIYGRILLVIWIILLCTSIIVSPCLFIFQYLQVCRAQWMTVYGRRSFLLFLTPIGIAWSAASMLIICAYPDAHELAYFDNIALHLYLNEPRAYLVASFQPRDDAEAMAQAQILTACCILLLCILLCNLLTMLICSRSIVVTVKRTSNERSSRLQSQVFKVLLVQFTIPFLFIQIPFCVCCLAPLFRMETDRMADYLPFLFAWSPVLNPIVVMYFVKDLRPSRKLLIFKSKSVATECPNTANAGQNTTYFLQKRSEGRNSNLPKNSFVTKAITAVSGI